MRFWKTIKNFVNAIIDILFMISYIFTLILSILDVFGVITFDSANWMKILVMMFSTVGIVVLLDKRITVKKIEPQVDEMDKNVKDSINQIDEIKKVSTDIAKKIDENIEIKYFPDKTKFYLFLTDLLLQLPQGATVDVTSFEKNYNIPYEKGENIYIETFMKTWDELIQNNTLNVRQLVHITSSQDYIELKERVNKFKSNHNFVLSAMVGLPIAPFIDCMIINRQYIFMGFSEDTSSPNNFSFGYVIKSEEVTTKFQNYFNIYWSDRFSVVVKDKDEIQNKNIDDIGDFINDIDHNKNLMKYNKLALELYHINEHNNSIIPMLENLHRLYGNVHMSEINLEIENKIKECEQLIDHATKDFIEFNRDEAADLIARVMFNATKKIIAISLDIDGNQFWIADEGEKVFQANVEAILRRKVIIQRVFVSTLDKKTEIDETIKEHINAGIDVHYTEYKNGIGNDFEDFLIIDNNVLLILASDYVKITLNKKIVEQYNRKFVDILKISSKCN